MALPNDRPEASEGPVSRSPVISTTRSPLSLSERKVLVSDLTQPSQQLQHLCRAVSQAAALPQASDALKNAHQVLKTCREVINDALSVSVPVLTGADISQKALHATVTEPPSSLTSPASGRPLFTTGPRDPLDKIGSHAQTAESRVTGAPSKP